MPGKFIASGALRLLLGCICLIAMAGCQYPFGKSGNGMDSGGAVPKNPCVVLALPDSGPHAQVAARIRSGARLAQEELKKNGFNLRLENINTEAPDWLAALDKLPQYCSVVGGPLQNRKYSQARAAGAVDKRTFFAFLAHLDGGDEGKRAWRFFPGPQDQIDALLNFTGNDLNIRSYGAFYPDDEYGRQMTGLLDKTVASRHMTVEKASYNRSSPATWAAAAKPLINPIYPDGGKRPVPQTGFEAVFLPDSWRNTEMLISSFLYNGEDRLVILGTTLWEQALNGKRVSSPEKYAIAVFPAAWDPTAAPAVLRGTGTDFWQVLGFDFVRFATQLEIYSRLPADQITAKAHRHAHAVSALAPIDWTRDGMASQKLFLFQPAASGMKRLNLTDFILARRQRLEQAALRFQDIEAPQSTQAYDEYSSPEMAKNPQEVGSAIAPADAGAPRQDAAMPAADVQNVAQPLGTVPQSSYKLRLPTKR